MQTQRSYSVPSLQAITGTVRQSGAVGYGNADPWSQHMPDLNERERLDELFILALTDQHVHDRLLMQHDTSLLDSFELSDETRHMLADLQGNSLEECARAIVAAAVPYRTKTATTRC